MQERTQYISHFGSFIAFIGAIILVVAFAQCSATDCQISLYAPANITGFVLMCIGFAFQFAPAVIDLSAWLFRRLTQPDV